MTNSNVRTGRVTCFYPGNRNRTNGSVQIAIHPQNFVLASVPKWKGAPGAFNKDLVGKTIYYIEEPRKDARGPVKIKFFSNNAADLE